MTSTDTTRRDIPAWLDRITPRAGVGVQLYAAAVVWCVAVIILLVRGVGFLHDRWFAALIALAFVIAGVKTRLILDGYARKAVARIHERGRACIFGAFAWKSWIFIVVMMGGGIWLRTSVLATNTYPWGKDALAVLYVAVGTALAAADRHFWRAALGQWPGRARVGND
jgi:hypothetical protein